MTDVDHRLAEGRQAVDTVQDYVWASHLLGYQNADLTLHASQLRDWFGTEDGMDLHALDADRTALVALVATSEDAVHAQQAQLRTLATAWEGAGADAAADFLRRHCDTAAAVVSAMRSAAESLGALRDNLWRQVDGKVAAVIEIEGRRLAERPVWLAAAHTIMTGAGDREAATETIEQQVKPFVDNDIRVDWLRAVRNPIAEIDACYAAATTEIGGNTVPRFEVPGDLGPTYTAHAPVVAAAPAVTAPAAMPPMPAMTPPPTPAMPVPPEIPAPELPSPSPELPLPAMPAMAAPAPAGDVGGGLPSASGGFDGLGQWLADVLGGLDGADTDEPDSADDDPVEKDDEKQEEKQSSPPDEPSDPAPAATDEPAAEPIVTEPPAPEVPPPPDEAPAADERTPCEIAADELPQAGQ